MKSHHVLSIICSFSITLPCVYSFQSSSPHSISSIRHHGYNQPSKSTHTTSGIKGECFFHKPNSFLISKKQESFNTFHRRPIRTTSVYALPLDVMVTMYKDSLLENPLQTKMLTGGVLAFLGDAIAQSREPRYDEKRAAAFVSFDVVYRAVQCSLFPMIVGTCDGHFLSSFLPEATSVDIRTLATMEQTFANQFLVIPFIYYPVFFTLTGYLQGLSMDASIERVQQTLLPLLKRNWLFWIPVQYFQFGYVEEPLQIPFLCVAGLAWTFILSALAGSVKSYNDSDKQEVEEELVVASAARPVTVPISTATMEEELVYTNASVMRQDKR